MQSKPIIFTDHDDSILNAYLKEISKCKIYKSEEINDLVVKAQAGDIEARNEAIKSNLRFVITMAKRWQNRGVPLLDLISEGNLGVEKAISLFDVTKGVPFINYAAHWIKQYVYQAIYWTGREVRLPISQQIKIITILKATSEFEKKYSRKPTTVELTEITNIPENEIDFLAQFVNKTISVDDYVGGDSENLQICDIIPDNEPLLDEVVNKKLLHAELEKVFSILTIREHDIICLFFGIGIEPLDSKQIGDLFGVGTERIRQLKEGALRKLKRCFGNKLKNLIK